MLNRSPCMCQNRNSPTVPDCLRHAGLLYNLAKANFVIFCKQLDLKFIMLQAREKFLSLRKGTKPDIATALEEVSFCISYIYDCICLWLLHNILKFFIYVGDISGAS